MKCFVISFKYNIYLYTCTYSSVKSDSAIAAELEQFNPRHSPHPTEHRRPCFLHTHRLVSQFCLQLHLMIFNSFSGAGGSSIRIGESFPHLISNYHVIMTSTAPTTICSRYLFTSYSIIIIYKISP